MALGITVAHDHRHILAHAFSTQSGFGEGSGHREEVNQAVVLGAEDAGHFRVFDVHIVDADVAKLALGQFHDFFVNRNRLGCIGGEYIVAETELLQTFGALLAVAQTNHLACDPGAFFGFVAAEHTALSTRADNQHGIARFYQFSCLGRRTGHIQCRQSQVFRKVGRNLGIDAAFKQDRLAVDVHLVYIGADILDFVNPQRGQRKRNQRGNLVAFLQVDFVLQRVADLFNRTQEHTSRTRHRIAVLALLGHDIQHDFSNLGLVATSLLLDLRKAGRVDIQRLHVNQDLIVVQDVHVVVQFVGGLGQHAFGRNYTVCTVFVAFRLHCDNRF